MNHTLLTLNITWNWKRALPLVKKSKMESQNKLNNTFGTDLYTLDICNRRTKAKSARRHLVSPKKSTASNTTECTGYNV